jgi:hypothetical protein
MPTEPQPITLADIARRAVQIADPEDADAVLAWPSRPRAWTPM